MILKSLALHNFRNYTDTVLALDPQLTLVIGPNARGKTNLLEAVHFASTGHGINEDKKEELLRFDSPDMDVRLICTHNDNAIEFRGMLHTAEDKISKTFFIDKTKKGVFSYTRETPPVVLFSPSFMNIIEGSPSKRRRFVDVLLSKIDIEYRKRLRNYENGIRKRNKVIEVERDEFKLRQALEFWDAYLIEQADYITSKREWFADYTQKHESLAHHNFTLDYRANKMTPERLEESFEKQYYQRRTLVGPQRDDFRILKKGDENKVDVHTYSSRGEQRLALFWLILHQLNIYSEYLDYPPVLLLDDIFSELDEPNREIVQELVSQYQTIITSAEDIPASIVKTDTIIRL